MGFAVVANSVAVEYGLTILDDDSINLWGTVQNYPRLILLDSDVYYEVILFHPKTGQKWQLADGYGIYGTEGDADWTQWSSDGQWLFYGVASNSENDPIYRAHWTGNRVEKIWEADSNFLGRNKLSPDQQWVAWQDIDASWQQSSIAIRRSNGSEIRLLATNLPFGFIPYFQPVVYWSPDSEWVYFNADMQNQSGNSITINWEIWRVRWNGNDLEQVLKFNEDEWIQYSTVTDEWVIYAIGQSGGASLYRVRVDGSDRQLVNEIDVGTLITDMWQPTDDDIIIRFTDDQVTYGNSYGQGFVHVDVESGDSRNLLHMDETQIVVARYGQHMVIYAMSDQEEWYRFVMDANGDNIVSYPNAPCQFENRISDRDAIWIEKNAYFLNSPDDDRCQLMQYQVGDAVPTIAQILPDGALDVRFLDTPSAQWLQYSIDGRRFITNIDGSVTFPIHEDFAYGAIAWTELPLKTANTTLLKIFGALLISGAMMGMIFMSISIPKFLV